MSGIMIRVGDKVAQAPATLNIQPGASVDIDLPLTLSIIPPQNPDMPNLPYNTTVRPPQRTPNVISMQGVWDLSPQRSERIDQMMSERPNLACVYAVMQDVPAVVGLDVPGAMQKHVQYVRALVPVLRGEP
jgi:hypothetical protein